jgi:hypothetical protein
MGLGARSDPKMKYINIYLSKKRKLNEENRVRMGKQGNCTESVEVGRKEAGARGLRPLEKGSEHPIAQLMDIRLIGVELGGEVAPLRLLGWEERRGADVEGRDELLGERDVRGRVEMKRPYRKDRLLISRSDVISVLEGK